MWVSEEGRKAYEKINPPPSQEGAIIFKLGIKRDKKWREALDRVYLAAEQLDW